MSNETITRVTANDLRAAAETADGFRDKPMALVSDGDAVAVMPSVEAREKHKDILLEVYTPREGNGLPGDATVKVLWHDKLYTTDIDPASHLASADAVFTTQSAVGKFVLPYYIRYRSPKAVQDLQDKVFKRDSVIAVLHFPPSHPITVEKGTDLFGIDVAFGIDGESTLIPIGRGF